MLLAIVVSVISNAALFEGEISVNDGDERKAATSYNSGSYSGGSYATATNQHVLQIDMGKGSYPSSPSGIDRVDLSVKDANFGNVLGTSPVQRTINTGASTTEDLPTYEQIGSTSATHVHVDVANPTGGTTSKAFKIYASYFVGSTLKVVVRYDYTLHKTVCDYDASIDKRKEYGQPNTAGAYPGDANGELRNVNFGSWTYKGGLFAGNALTSYGDFSGTARMQFRIPSFSPTGTFRLSTLSLWPTFSPASAFQDTTRLGAYFPTESTEPSEGTLTWDTRWSSIAPETNPNPVTDYTKHAISDFNAGLPASPNDYTNWLLIPPPDKTNWPWPGQKYRVAIALYNETHEDVYDNVNAWRYYASKEWESTYGSLASLTDVRPRIWSLYYTTTTVWTAPEAK